MGTIPGEVEIILTKASYLPLIGSNLNLLSFIYPSIISAPQI
jgi:hypothetical protein